MKDEMPKHRSTIYRNTEPIQNRLLIAVPTLGNIRAEWAMARWGQVIPTNWSHADVMQFMDQNMPIGFSVADARNVCCREVVEKDFEWLLFIDDDVIIPHDIFIKINDYIRKGDIPVVSGLYFTKSIPPEPLIYRGRGTSYYSDWKVGDKVWVDGIPMGLTLIHGSIIKKMYTESEDYMVGTALMRRVFETPSKVWYDEEKDCTRGITGTEDLTWCTRVMEEGFLERSGWKDFAKKHPQYPFLLDTSMYCQHINPRGHKFPGIQYTWDRELKLLEGEKEEDCPFR